MSEQKLPRPSGDVVKVANHQIVVCRRVVLRGVHVELTRKRRAVRGDLAAGDRCLEPGA